MSLYECIPWEILSTCELWPPCWTRSSPCVCFSRFGVDGGEMEIGLTLKSLPKDVFCWIKRQCGWLPWRFNCKLLLLRTWTQIRMNTFSEGIDLYRYYCLLWCLLCLFCKHCPLPHGVAWAMLFRVCLCQQQGWDDSPSHHTTMIQNLVPWYKAMLR